MTTGAICQEVVVDDRWSADNDSIRPEQSFWLCSSIPDLSTRHVQSFATHESCPLRIGLGLHISSSWCANRPVEEPFRTSACDSPGHCMPGPSSLSSHLDAVATADTYRHNSSSFLVWVIDLVFTTSDEKNAITAKTEACEGSFTLLTNIAMDWHVVLGPVKKTNPGLWRDVREQARYLIYEVSTSCWLGLVDGTVSRRQCPSLHVPRSRCQQGNDFSPDMIE